MSDARRKGTAAESAVVAYLQSLGFSACERRALAGKLDRGDIAGIPDWTLEVKASVSRATQSWLAEVERERLVSGTRYGAVVHKPRGINQPGRYEVIMTLETLGRLLRNV